MTLLAKQLANDAVEEALQILNETDFRTTQAEKDFRKNNQNPLMGPCQSERALLGGSENGASQKIR